MTVPDATPKAPPLPNYSLTVETRGPAGSQAEYLTARFGNPVRSVTVRPLTMGDQWDLAEITPANVSETWSNMAQLAYSVTDIEGVPVPRLGATRQHLRNTLDKLGVDGLRAASMALARVFDQAAPDAAPTPDAAPAPGAVDPALMAAAKN